MIKTDKGKFIVTTIFYMKTYDLIIEKYIINGEDIYEETKN